MTVPFGAGDDRQIVTGWFVVSSVTRPAREPLGDCLDTERDIRQPVRSDVIGRPSRTQGAHMNGTARLDDRFIER